MTGAWLIAVLAVALQWDLPLALGPLTVYHNELLMAALVLSLPWTLPENRRRKAMSWAWAGLPLLLWLLGHAYTAGAGEALKGALRGAQFLLALALPGLLLVDARGRDLAWRVFFGMVCFTATWAMVQSFSGAGFLNAGREIEIINGFQAAAAGMGHHNQLGAFLVAALAAAGAVVIGGRSRTAAPGVLVLILGSGALFCTYSRGTWLGALLVIGVLLLRAPWRLRVGAALSGSFLVLGAWLWPGRAFRLRLLSLTQDGERNLQRANLLKSGEGHGIWGLGPDGMREAVTASARILGGGEPHPAFVSHAHNSWLQWGLTWGWPVLLLWGLALTPLLSAMRAGLRRHSTAALALLGAVAAFGLQAWTDNLFLHARGAAVALAWGLILAELQGESE